MMSFSTTHLMSLQNKTTNKLESSITVQTHYSSGSKALLALRIEGYHIINSMKVKIQFWKMKGSQSLHMVHEYQ